MAHLPASSVPTRLDASYGVQLSPNASFDEGYAHPTMYQIPGLSPTSPTLPEPPFSATMSNHQHQDTTSLAANFTDSTPVAYPSLSQHTYAGDPPSSPDYHGQDSVYTEANFNPNPTFTADPSLSQNMLGPNGDSSPNYHGQDYAGPAANFNPNPTFIADPSLSQNMLGSDEASSSPNYHVQDNASPAANFNPNPTFTADPSLSQNMLGSDEASSSPDYHVRDNASPAANFNPNPTFTADPSLSQNMPGTPPPNYHGQGNVRPAADLDPTCTLVLRSSPIRFTPASDTSNYQVPNVPPANVTLPMFPMNTQGLHRYLTSMLPGDGRTAFLKSEGNSRRDHAASQSALPMGAPVTAAGTSSARPSSLQHGEWKEFPGVRLQVKNHKSGKRRNAKASTDGNGRERYYCDSCKQMVFLHRKKFHDRKHAGEYACRICEVLGEPCEPLSRKDSLKRHIELKHRKFLELLHNAALGLLTPRPKGAKEDLTPLSEAMYKIASS